MPYRQNADLPPSVRGHLPDHAQDVYREPDDLADAELAGERDREQRAHMIAWSAVKRTYVREDSGWVER